MSRGLREVRREEVNAELLRVLAPRLVHLLSERQPGHCMRVGGLDVDLMVELCRAVRAQFPGAQVHVLIIDTYPLPLDVGITATKLVELRNPLADGTRRPPLLVFVPEEARASAEDSFGEATFEVVRLGDVYGEVREHLLAGMPNGMRTAVEDVVCRLEIERWPYADRLAIVRYLLTVRVNDNDPDAAGGALFELGLIPDFEALRDPTVSGRRVLRNLGKMRILAWSGRSDRGRVLELGLASPAFRADLAEFVARTGLANPRAWARRIVVEPDNWRFAFQHWRFAEEDLDQEILVEVMDTSLPRASGEEEDERIARLAGHPYLAVGPQGQRSFWVSFRTEPAASLVHGLDRFAAQVFTQEGDRVGVVAVTRVGSVARSEFRATFRRLDRVEWEEGWHHVRVDPLTAEGDPIPLRPPPGGRGGIAPVSELFYVLPEADLEVPTPDQPALRAESLSHAWRDLQFAALARGEDPGRVVPRSVRWKEAVLTGRESRTAQLDLRFTGGVVGQVAVPRALRDVEWAVLQAPDELGSRCLVMDGTGGCHLTTIAADWGRSGALAAFLEARKRYFTSLLGGDRLITQAVDPRSLQDEAVAYAASYQELLSDVSRQVEMAPEDRRSDALERVRTLLLIDGVTLRVQDSEGGVREAALLGPTHPLRALWLVTWAAVAESWIKSLTPGDAERVAAVRQAVLGRLTPGQVPPLVSRLDGRALIAFENVNFCWTLYVPPEDRDPRGLADLVRTALDASLQATGGSGITGAQLAAVVARYLRQHPYVQRLRLNALNPGRGAVITEMLLNLQRDFADVSYDIRLFVPDTSMPEAGADIAALRAPEATQVSAEADAFSRPGSSHMDTKLALAVRSTSEFVTSPGDHQAHISLLFDVFSHHEVGLWSGEAAGRAVAPVHGLWQGFQVKYVEDEEIVAWHQRPRHGRARDLTDFEPLTDLMSELPQAVSAATAVAVAGQTGPRLLPEVTLALLAEDRSLIHQLHEVSDWVVTVDRNLGVEFFDHGGRRDRPDYLIDHSPDVVSGGSRRLVVTSRSLEELEAMFGPVLLEHGLPAEGACAAALFDQLRFLSGRLGFKLISVGQQRREALGLALARLYLDYQGALRDQIVVPLDAHPELARSRDAPGDDLALQRTDLAIFDLDTRERMLTCRLVEVKCHGASGDPGVLTRLKGQIVAQLEGSRRMLTDRFQLAGGRGPDGALAALDLSTLLGFHLDRSVRYGIFDGDAEREARAFLQTLENGYRLRFTKSALVFDLDRTSTDAVEAEADVEYHLVGHDSIRRLVESACEQGAAGVRDRAGTTGSLAQLELGVVRRETAAFLATARDRTFDPDVSEATAPAEPEATPDQESADGGPLPVPPPPVPSADRPAARERPAVEEASVQLGLQAGEPDVLLGTTVTSPQWGILGQAARRIVGLDLNETHTISLFGVQGGGKSYTLGSIVEMATVPIPGLNRLPCPLATVIFHYSPTPDYAPEFTSMVAANDDRGQVRELAERFGTSPAALEDMVLVVPEEQVEQRRAEHPELSVRPLKFAASELQSGHWRFLMGAVGNRSVYIRQVNRIMRDRRHELTLASIRDGIEESRLPEHLKEMARQRLDLAATYVDDGAGSLAEVVRPGRLVIVDLRDEFIERDEALGLFVVLLQLFAGAQHEDGPFNKLVVFDEAHKYIDSPDLVAGLVEVVREMRHKGTSVMIASQDPPSVPIAVIELSTQIILHRFNSPMWLRHVQKANAALGELSIERMTHLAPGEAYVWSSRATDDSFSRGTVKIRCRPRITLHGGQTRRAFTEGE